jgi:hypothetical protein
MNRVNNEGVMKEAKEGNNNAKKECFSLEQQNLFLAPHIPGFLPSGWHKPKGGFRPSTFVGLPSKNLAGNFSREICGSTFRCEKGKYL